MHEADAFEYVTHELRHAQVKFPPFRSAHEGYAILLEEVDELWQEVKHGTDARRTAEAIQVAAMAIRFLIDVCQATPARDSSHGS